MNRKAELARIGFFFLFLFVLVFVFGQFGKAQQTVQSTPAPLHQVDKANGLNLLWQTQNMFAGFKAQGPFMAAGNGKVLFMGGQSAQDLPGIMILNGKDGKFITKIGAVDAGSSFTVADALLFIGNSNGEVLGYNFETSQRTWYQMMGNEKNPCCFQVVNGQLQTSWNLTNAYSLSVNDGKTLQKLTVTGGPVYRVENDAIYAKAGLGQLNAARADGENLWNVDLGEYSQPPVFGKEILYVRLSREQGAVYAVDRQTGKIVWKSSTDALSNLVLASRYLYFLTTAGRLQGVDPLTGKEVVSAQLSGFQPASANPPAISYEVAYDPAAHTVFLLLGDSAQVFAFTE